MVSVLAVQGWSHGSRFDLRRRLAGWDPGCGFQRAGWRSVRGFRQPDARKKWVEFDELYKMHVLYNLLKRFLH